VRDENLTSIFSSYSIHPFYLADMTQFYKQYKSIEPFLKNDNPPEKGWSHLIYAIISFIEVVVLTTYRRVFTITRRPQEA